MYLPHPLTKTAVEVFIELLGELLSVYFCPEMDTKAKYEVVHSLNLVPKIRTHRD